MQSLLDDPWAIATTVVSLTVAFLAWLFREVIRDVLLGRLKSCWEHKSRVAELERRFSSGEREMLAALARTGGFLIVSTREIMEGCKNPVRLVDLTKEWRLPTAAHSEVLALYRQGFLDGDGGHATRLTDRGRDVADGIVSVFGTPEILSTPPRKAK